MLLSFLFNGFSLLPQCCLTFCTLFLFFIKLLFLFFGLLSGFCSFLLRFLFLQLLGFLCSKLALVLCGLCLFPPHLLCQSISFLLFLLGSCFLLPFLSLSCLFLLRSFLSLLCIGLLLFFSFLLLCLQRLCISLQLLLFLLCLVLLLLGFVFLLLSRLLLCFGCLCILAAFFSASFFFS